MLCLGIECTAHTFGAGVVDEKGKVLSLVNETYKPKAGGIIPADAASFMKKIGKETIDKALAATGKKIGEIDVIAFSQGPGLPPTLRAGGEIVALLAKEAGKPVIGVNHCVAHIEIGRIATGAKDPVILYVSGGNSQVIAYAAGRYRVFGETLDIAVGNALDKFARGAGLGFPGGPKIEETAKGGNYVELPYTVKGMDFAFSGLATAAERLLTQKKAPLADVCFSFQETAFAMLTEVVERAMAHTGKSEALLVGGVAANKRLTDMLETMCRERGARFYAVPMEWAGDNGAMIGWAGLLEWLASRKPLKDFAPKPRWRTDEVEVLWWKY